MTSQLSNNGIPQPGNGSPQPFDQTEVYRAQNSGEGSIPITGDLQQRLEEKNELEKHPEIAAIM